jgi:putative membrane protein
MSRLPVAQRGMLVALAIGSLLSGWGAIYPSNTWLQVGPVLLTLPLAVWALQRWPLSNRAAGLITAFLLLHLLAACWSYGFTPYDAWSRRLLGISIDATFGFERNMFDRLVHLCFGLWLVLPLAEIAIRHGGLTRGAGLLMAVLGVFAFSSVYEIFEWMLTLGLAPDQAGAYNGEQGDMYDGQKDMALANLGALLAVIPARVGLPVTTPQERVKQV